MRNIDYIFLKVLKDEQLSKEFNISASRITSLDEGLRAVNPQVRAIAETLNQLNKKIEEYKSSMSISNTKGPIVIPEPDMQVIYKKIVASLSK